MPQADIKRQGEMFQIIEQYQKSGLSQAEFCQQTGIKKSTFHYWLKKYRKESQADFLPISIKEPKASLQIELELPNGIKISIKG
ncbi:MAG: transposase [Calditrichaeota bacterium]|nr:transposase [Calditrichota bacterium]